MAVVHDNHEGNAWEYTCPVACLALIELEDNGEIFRAVFPLSFGEGLDDMPSPFETNTLHASEADADAYVEQIKEERAKRINPTKP